MSREVLPYVDEATRNAQRAVDLTSTDVAALFNLSPYATAFELWHTKRGGLAVEDFNNERMNWGLRLQYAIALGFSQDRGLDVRWMREYVRDPDLRIGSSFDFCEDRRELYEKVFPMFAADEQCPAPSFLVEVKNVDGLIFRRDWTETDFGLEAPAHIELQAQHQMLVADVAKCYIVALVSGNTLHVLERERDTVISQRILDACARFWAMTEPPAPDYLRDYDTISRLHGYSSAGKVIDATGAMVELMAQYKAASADESAAEQRKKIAKARLLEMIGDAERVESDGYTLSAKTVGESEIAAYTRKGYRGFRVNERKA